MSAHIDEEEVRRTAYFLWEQDGRPEGRAQEYWYRAWAQHRRMRGYDDELESGLHADEPQDSVTKQAGSGGGAAMIRKDSQLARPPMADDADRGHRRSQLGRR